MNLTAGQTFSIGADNRPVPGCTISEEIHKGDNSTCIFTLAKNTDISPEMYPCHKFLIMNAGSMDVYGWGKELKLNAGDALIAPTQVPVGMNTKSTGDEAVYTEIYLLKESVMNEAVKPGVTFKLADLVPYQDGKIVNMDVVHNEKMKFVIMAFDEGTGLGEHSAPGEAIIFALDGEGVIGYGGEEHAIKAGENFHFEKGGLHSVKANGRFKMALLLTLE